MWREGSSAGRCWAMQGSHCGSRDVGGGGGRERESLGGETTGGTVSKSGGLKWVSEVGRRWKRRGSRDFFMQSGSLF